MNKISLCSVPASNANCSNNVLQANFLNDYRIVNYMKQTIVQQLISDKSTPGGCSLSMMSRRQICDEIFDRELKTLLGDKHDPMMNRFVGQTKANFGAWVRTSAHFHLLNIISESKRDQQKVGSLERMEQGCAGEAGELVRRGRIEERYEETMAEMRSRLDWARLKLSPKSREVVDILLAPENYGRSHKELAQMMGLSENVFNRRYFNAVRKIRGLLASC